jgi:hypothetical protein
MGSNSGMHRTDEQRANISAKLMGHPVSAETRAKIGTANTGKNPSPEARAKMGAIHRGHPFTPEHKAKISAANTGKVRTPEMRARLSVAKKGIPSSRKGIPASDETRAKISAAKTNPSLETRERMSAAKRGKCGPLSSRWAGGSGVSSRKSAARRRTLGFVLLNKPFDGCEGHHVDNEQVINIPKELHRSIWHRQTSGVGMAKINAVAYNFLFKQEIEAALGVQNASIA